MSLIRRLFVAVALVAVALAPVAYLPTLALHGPTIGAVSRPAPASPHLPGLGLEGVSLLGAIRIKDTAAIARKFVTRAQGAGQDYSEGVGRAGQDWQANALAAEGNYEQGVQASIADKRFGKGINAAGSAKYVENATKLGPQRFQTGVAQAESAYARGVQPHLDMMKSLDLPPRGPKGSPNNQARANAVAVANRRLKLGK